MGYYLFGIDRYFIILILPAMLIAFYAQAKVKSTFAKYSTVFNSRGLTGSQVAKRILMDAGLSNVQVEPIAGELSDQYDPKSNIVRLSQSVYDSNSVAAIGVAAHEVGHAIQHNEGYMPIKLRNSVLPVAQIGTYAAFPLAIIGLMFSIGPLINVGILLYSAVVLFQLVTLPVEFNASSRAMAILTDKMILTEDEALSAKKVLSAAAFTYVASAIAGIASLLRLILLGNRRN